jgi:hypothetical protein
LDGGRLELPGVLVGWLSRASSAATRAVKVCTCAHSVPGQKGRAICGVR